MGKLLIGVITWCNDWQPEKNYQGDLEEKEDRILVITCEGKALRTFRSLFVLKLEQKVWNAFHIPFVIDMLMLLTLSHNKMEL